MIKNDWNRGRPEIIEDKKDVLIHCLCRSTAFFLLAKLINIIYYNGLQNINKNQWMPSEWDGTGDGIDVVNKESIISEKWHKNIIAHKKGCCFLFSSCWRQYNSYFLSKRAYFFPLTAFLLLLLSGLVENRKAEKIQKFWSWYMERKIGKHNIAYEHILFLVVFLRAVLGSEWVVASKHLFTNTAFQFPACYYSKFMTGSFVVNSYDDPFLLLLLLLLLIRILSLSQIWTCWCLYWPWLD